MSWNDVVNSIKVPEGWEIIIYEHTTGNFKGKSLTFTKDWVANPSWRNKISNITVVKKTSAQVILYRRK